MHAAVCLLHAGQLNRAGDVAKSVEFLGEFYLEELFPLDVRGLTNFIQNFKINNNLYGSNLKRLKTRKL